MAKAKVTAYIGRGSQGGDFHLQIQDSASGVVFLDGYLSVQAFADLMSNRHAECACEIQGLHLIGTKHESKSEVVRFDSKASLETKLKAVAAFEVDGWFARGRDVDNHHCRVDGGARCVFFRFVDPVTGAPVIDPSTSTPAKKAGRKG